MDKTISRNICCECGAKRVNCCCNEDYYLAVTINDIRKIISHGFKIKDCIEAAGFEEKELEDEQWWKDAMIKIKNKLYRISLIEKKDGKCIFLKNRKGCILGDDRPALCKLFPFWIKRNKIIYYDDFCEIVQQKIPLREALDIIGETKEKIREYYAEVKEDFLKNHGLHEKLTYLLLQKRYNEFEKAVNAKA